jgi:hypothetical protein
MRLSRFPLILLTLAVLKAQAPERGQTNSFGSSGGNIHDTAGSNCCGGTFGAAVTDGSKIYILSNSHVLGFLGQAHPGDEVIQPGLLDNQCKASRVVGHLTVALPVPNRNGPSVDAAIAELVPGTMDPQGSILHIGTLGTQTALPVKDLKVAKAGPSTGLTQGNIQTASLNAKVDYSEDCRPGPPAVLFNNLTLIAGAGGFGQTGDSGSLVVTAQGHNPVGLLIATNGTYALAHPIGPVLDALSKALGRTLNLVGPGQSVGTAGAEFVGSEAYTTGVSARQELWNRIRADSAVLAVGFSLRRLEGRGRSAAQAELDVFLEKGRTSRLVFDLLENVEQLGERRTAKYKGLVANVIETPRFRAAARGNGGGSPTCRP